MREPYFLSIDMDFFNEIDVPAWRGMLTDQRAKAAYLWLCSLHGHALERGIPFGTCMNHQQMLDAVNKSTSRILVNYDEHSDLCKNDCVELNCGTWIAYVRWRHEGKYIWNRSSSRWVGDCGLDFSKTTERSKTDWGSIHTHYIERLPRPSRLAAEASDIWVCMSPAYASPFMQEAFQLFVREHNVPYWKGRRGEYHGRDIRPPRRIKGKKNA